MNKLKILFSLLLLSFGMCAFSQEQLEVDRYVNRYFSIQYPVAWEKQEISFDNICFQTSFREPDVAEDESFHSSMIVVKWYRKTSKSSSDLVEDFNEFYRAKYENPEKIDIETQKMQLRFGGYDGLTTSFFIKEGDLYYNHQIFALTTPENRGFIVTVSINAKDKETLEKKRKFIDSIISDFHVYGGFVEQDLETVE